jgi:hypothetical protein
MFFPPSAGRIANDLVSAKPPAPRPPRPVAPPRGPRPALQLVPPFKLLRVGVERLRPR